MAFLVGDFINSKSGDAFEFAVFEAIFDHPLHGTINFVPRGLKALGGLFPTESFAPRSQKVTKGIAGTVLAFGPRNLFDFHSAPRAIDPAHGVEKIDWDIPKGNEGEASLSG